MKPPSYYKENSRKSFDKYTPFYDKSSKYGFGKHASGVYPQILERLREIDFNTILDIGIGTGEIISTLMKERNFKAAGIDISPKMIEVARGKLGEDVELKVGDSEELDWDKNLFDIVICNDSFHHYPRPQIVMEEISRVLKLGGYLLITDVYVPHISRWLYNLIYKFRSKSGDAKLYSKGEMIKFAERANFQEIKWKRLGLSSYILTASKRT